VLTVASHDPALPCGREGSARASVERTSAICISGGGVVQRIEPVSENAVSPAVQRAFDDAARRGAPNPTLLRILARHPVALYAFYDGWQSTFYEGIVEHPLKELMRVRMARLRNCGY
jgi:hypothetical protein